MLFIRQSHVCHACQGGGQPTDSEMRRTARLSGIEAFGGLGSLLVFRGPRRPAIKPVAFGVLRQELGTDALQSTAVVVVDVER